MNKIHDAMLAAVSECSSHLMEDMDVIERQDPDRALKLWCAIATNHTPEHQAREIRVRADRACTKLHRSKLRVIREIAGAARLASDPKA